MRGARGGDQGGGAHGDEAARARGGAGGAQNNIGALGNAGESPGQAGAHDGGILMGAYWYEQAAGAIDRVR